MNLTIFTGPDPGKNIKELLRRTPFASASLCAVVPDFRSASAMEQRIARISGGAVLGHRVYTFDGLARAVLSYGSHSPGVVTGHVKRALVAEILRSRLGKVSRYAAVAETRGFARAVEAFLEESRADTVGVRGESDFFPVSRAYESHLSRLGVTDHEGAVREAVSSPELIGAFAASCTGPLIIDGFYDLTASQFDLLELLMRQVRRTAVSLVTDLSRPELFSLPLELLERYRRLGARIIEIPAGDDCGADIVRAGFMGGQYQGTDDRNGVSFDFFSSAASEADWVAGTVRDLITDGGCRPGDILVAARNTPGHTSHLALALHRHGIPVEGGGNIPLSSAPLVRFVFDALDASIVPVQERIRAVLQSGFSGIGVSDGIRAGGFLDDRGWSSMTAEVDSPEGFASSTRRMLEALNVPGSLDGCGNRAAAVSERAVYERLLGLLDEFAAFYMTFKPMMRAREFITLFRQFIAEITMSVSPVTGEGVLVLGVEHARYCSRDIVFLTGLDNSSFPAGTERYTLHDDRTAARLRDRREREEPLLFYMALTGARRLYMTFPGIDNEGGYEALSPYVREIREGISVWSTTNIHRGIPGAAWEHGPASERGRRESILRLIVRNQETAGALLSDLRERKEEVFHAAEHALQLALGINGEQGLTISDAESIEGLRYLYGNEHIFPVTGIESYLGCPVKFFLSHVLGLRTERIAEDGIDAGERGSIMHEILACFYDERKKTLGKTGFIRNEIETVMAQMNTVIDRVFSLHQDRLKHLSPMVLTAEKRMVRRWIREVVDLEAQWFEVSPFRPAMFEKAFGNAENPPLEITDDDTVVRLSGRIDRIDVADCDSGTMSRIVDYKTGASPRRTMVERGEAIQLPLYIIAANELVLPEVKVAEACYYSLRNAKFDAAKQTITQCTVIDGAEDEVIESAKGLALHAAKGIRLGRFPAPESCSDRCEWRTLCRGERSGKGEAMNADL